MKKSPDILRAWPVAVVALVMFCIAVATSHISLAVTVYGLAKITAAAYIGYWIDRALFPYARPHDAWICNETLYTSPFPQIRRAVIVAACIIAAGLIP